MLFDSVNVVISEKNMQLGSYLCYESEGIV